MKTKRFSVRNLMTCSVILSLPVFLYGFSVWSWMWRSVGLRDWETCAQSYSAVSKGTFWYRGEWHHYIDIAVDDIPDPENYRWRVVEAPMPSSINRVYSEKHVVRVTYRWSSNWHDPFSLDRWKVCRINS